MLCACDGFAKGTPGIAASANTAPAPVSTDTRAQPPTRSPEPTPTPEPTVEPSVDPVSRMALDDKIAQLFFLAFRNDANGADVTEVNAEIARTLENHAVGGVILFAENVHGAEQTAAFVRDMQSKAKIPLFIGIDEEGGRVSRTRALDVPRVPAALKIGAAGDPENAYDAAATIANYLTPLGVNLDFAPVADVFTNPANDVIGDRAFSRDAEDAADYVAAFTRGLSDNGVSSCLKHFPGHGDTAADSHYGTASAPYTLEELENREFIPFRAGLAAGADFVMIGHISAPNVTGNDEPATFSKVFTEILRSGLGFDGVIVTDSLQMGAVGADAGEAALRAFQAGADVLLMPENFEQAFNAIKTAVEAGEIDMPRLDASVRRILDAKRKRGLAVDYP